MNLFKMNVSDIVVSHLESDDCCFHVINTVLTKSKYLRNSLLYVSEKKELYGVSFSLYKSMLNHGIDECYVIRVPGSYDERFDFYLHNITSNATFFYYRIKEKYPNHDDLSISEFDGNQIDLMYSTRLKREIEETTSDENILEMKRDYKITILLRTPEDNAKIQKALSINESDTHNNTINKRNSKTKKEIKNGKKERKKELIVYFNHFKNVCIDKKPREIVGQLPVKSNKEQHLLTPFPYIIIQCNNIDEMNTVLDFLKINKDKQKTTRINFKRVEKVFK